MLKKASRRRFGFRKERPQAALIAWMRGHSEDRARRKPKRSRGRTAVSDKTGTLTIGVAASSETQLLTDIRHDYLRTFLRSNDDATTGDVQEIVDEPPLLAT